MADLRSELRAINDQHGGLTPRLVVEAARPKDSPLHAIVFDRTVKDAAEAYYLGRARDLIRTVKRAFPEDAPPSDQKTVREYVAVRTESDDNGGFLYQPADMVALDPVARRIVLRDMEREWRTLKARYEDFEEFVDLITADPLIAAA